MTKNPLNEFILDKLAAGETFSQLTTKYGITRQEFINAAVYGISELRGEYISLLSKRRAH
ncbi:MAG TPA: hypothetical protein PKO06_05970 [Candidatus Ozemobacteraceae bacterium]|nr:hypothetical protein [Candidatus Ozemobacteraceae bacterium]